MKDINDFINRANKFKSGWRHTVESESVVNEFAPWNNNTMEQSNESYETFEDNYEGEDDDHTEKLKTKKKATQKKQNLINNFAFFRTT